jgi:hypothetical protein
VVSVFDYRRKIKDEQHDKYEQGRRTAQNLDDLLRNFGTKLTVFYNRLRWTACMGG